MTILGTGVPAEEATSEVAHIAHAAFQSYQASFTPQVFKRFLVEGRGKDFLGVSEGDRVNA